MPTGVENPQHTTRITRLLLLRSESLVVVAAPTAPPSKACKRGRTTSLGSRGAESAKMSVQGRRSGGREERYDARRVAELGL